MSIQCRHTLHNSTPAKKMAHSTPLRKKILQDVFDYQTLITALADYSSPRDRINRLVNNGEITRIKKGLYVFGDDLRKQPIPQMYFANLLSGPSYVSLDYALQYYSLIPERVFEITSVTVGRSKKIVTPIGDFSYKHIPLSTFPVGMDIIQENVEVSCLIANPEKAMVDKVLQGPSVKSRKQMSEYICDDLRLDPLDLTKMNIAKITEYCHSYGTHKSKLLFQVMLQLKS